VNYCLDLSAAAHERAGFRRYVAALAQALIAEGVPLKAFVYDLTGSRLRSPLRELPTLTAGLPRRRWRLRAAISHFGGPAMDRVIPGVALFHATEHLLPKFRRTRSVFTLHDTAYLLFPQYHLPRNRIFLQQMMPRFLARADRIIVPSESTRRDALRFYRLDPEKIEVIPEGVEAHFNSLVDKTRVAAVRERYALPKRFILCVGTIEPRKNLPTLLEAYAALGQRDRDVGLVIAGGKGWLYDEFFDRLRSLNLGDRVRLTGYVPEEDLPALLNAATVFAFPSEFEGFGLPPLEAMACGVPVLCSDASSLPEVVGEAGVQLPPHDVRAWAEALGRVLQDEQLRAGLRARGLERARAFTWEKTARRTLEVYRSVSADNGER
jgi:glycosyltransferase involved in cell wall biosynthesis